MTTKSNDLIMILALALFFEAAPGCIFQPRDAEPPGTDAGSTWEPADVPSKVFINLRTGVVDLTGVNYERSLNGNFTFIPTPEDERQLGPDVFANWDVDVEKQVLQKILGDASIAEVSFVNPQNILGTSTTATFQSPYILTITDQTSGNVNEFQAVAEFDMVKVGSGWQLIQWRDIEFVEGFATWGFLRGNNRQVGN